MRALLIVLTLLLAACGWHLRGPVVFNNLPALAIKGGSNALRYPLMNNLADSGVVVSDSADITLRLLSESWDKRTVAVDTQGRVAAIELTYHLLWQLEKDGKPITAPRTISLINNVNQDPVNATAASDELELSQQSMRQDAIWQLQRQLQSISQHQDLSAPPPQEPPRASPH